MNIAISLLLLVATSTALLAQPSKSATPSIKTTQDLVKYVGTYPCSNGLLQQRVLLSALKSVLGSDYQLYREHMRLSGCGAIEQRDGFLLLDISQLHTGGYTSLLFVRNRDGALFLFWLKSTVAEKQCRFYGDRPIPTEVTQVVDSELNKIWGHVAQFKVVGDSVEIRLNVDKRN